MLPAVAVSSFLDAFESVMARQRKVHKFWEYILVWAVLSFQIASIFKIPRWYAVRLQGGRQRYGVRTVFRFIVFRD